MSNGFEVSRKPIASKNQQILRLILERDVRKHRNSIEKTREPNDIAEAELGKATTRQLKKVETNKPRHALASFLSAQPRLRLASTFIGPHKLFGSSFS